MKWHWFIIILIQFSDKKAWMENSLTIEHKIAGYGEQESLNGNELGLEHIYL